MRHRRRYGEVNRCFETSRCRTPALRDLVGGDLRDAELERLARVDASLRAAAARDRRRQDAPTGPGTGACAAPRTNPPD